MKTALIVLLMLIGVSPVAAAASDFCMFWAHPKTKLIERRCNGAADMTLPDEQKKALREGRATECIMQQTRSRRGMFESRIPITDIQCQ